MKKLIISTFIFLLTSTMVPSFVHGNALIDTKKDSEKIAYLTFDDGPSHLTPKIMDILREKDIKATFFVVGKTVMASEDILKQLASEGHAIGNHTYSHNYSTIYKNKENFFEDFYKNEELLLQLTGIKTKLVRLPGGSNNATSKLYGEKYLMNKITEELSNSGYIYFDWNVSSRDANGKNFSATEIVETTLLQTAKKNPAIILFHDSAGKGSTLEALPRIIEGLEKQGFTFATLSDDSYRVTFHLPKMKSVQPVSTRPPISKYLMWKLKKIEEITEGIIIP